jgi:GT2 family glycosyltransferase
MADGRVTNAASDVRVAAIVVNWRRPELTIAAARHVAVQTYPADLIVVDNGSGDGSADAIEQALPDASLIRMDKNGGFGTGCNAGIAHALDSTYDHVWLINNDAEPQPDALAKLVEAMADKSVGIVGSRLTEPHGKVDDHAGAIMNPATLGCRASLSAVELNAARWSWISGASALIRLDAIKTAGVFDEGFFMYWEDADLCTRLRSAGYRLAVAEDSIVAHEAGTSSANQSVNRYRWHLESHMRFIGKHMRYPRIRSALLLARYLSTAARDLDGWRCGMVANVMTRRV